LFTILNRNQHFQGNLTTSTPTGNPLQKLLGELGKGESGPSADTLMSLLPLLNSPQIKSKLNPTTIAAILGLVNNFGNTSGNNEKEQGKEKKEKTEKTEIRHSGEDTPAAAVTTGNIDKGLMFANNNVLAGTQNSVETLSEEKKALSRFLNWKNSF